ESDDGNSLLARKANNHFGIKCHSDWEGKTFHQDDDAENECFRKYKSVEESYRDHSDFLSTRKRYAFLFDLDPTDYRKWAEGLKKAGYATNPKYPKLLIGIIEDNELHKLDISAAIAGNEQPDNHRCRKQKKNRKGIGLGDPDNYTVSLSGRKVMVRNGVRYIAVKQGDTFSGLAKEFEMQPGVLCRYNDLTKDSVLKTGEILYLQPKRRKAEPGKERHTLVPGETPYTVSQQYGIRLKSLCRMNNMEQNAEVTSSTVLNLRKKK
ncbi:MAG: glucosaminidase domain-containing protein, partial [Bacteroidetes bacterium]|nr:glucosaminidase domain-containing protein [Bacteroidota bacterium]